MSQANRPKREGAAPPPPRNPLPAILSAAAVVVLLGGLVLMLLTNSGGGPTAAAPTPAPFAAEPTAAAPAVPTVDPAVVAARNDKYASQGAPPMTIDPQKSYTATITTPRGDIVIKLRPDLAPQTVNSFVFLARDGFYNGITWHRVLNNFMAQGGDPTGTGGGGPGYTIPGEFTDKVLFDHPGVVAMARPGNDVNGNGSQFFITTAPYASLNQQYTVFGEVTQGQEFVTSIPLRDPDQNPTTPGEQIVKITIAEQ